MPDRERFSTSPPGAESRRAAAGSLAGFHSVMERAETRFMTRESRAPEARRPNEYLPEPFDLKELVAVVGPGAMSRPAPGPGCRPREGEEGDIPGSSGRLAGAMQEDLRARALARADARPLPDRDEHGAEKLGHPAQGAPSPAALRTTTASAASGPFVARETIGGRRSPARPDRERASFGHEKGGLHGAPTQRSAGRFERAEGGTLFLRRDRRNSRKWRPRRGSLRVLQQGEYTDGGRGQRPNQEPTRNPWRATKQGPAHIDPARPLRRGPVLPPQPSCPCGAAPCASARRYIAEPGRHVSSGRIERRASPANRSDRRRVDRLKRYRWPGNVRGAREPIRRLAALYPAGHDQPRRSSRARSTCGRSSRRRTNGGDTGEAPETLSRRGSSGGGHPDALLLQLSARRCRLRASTTASCARSKDR